MTLRPDQTSGYLRRRWRAPDRASGIAVVKKVNHLYRSRIPNVATLSRTQSGWWGPSSHEDIRNSTRGNLSHNCKLFSGAFLRCEMSLLADFVAEVRFEGLVWCQVFLAELRPASCRSGSVTPWNPCANTLNALLRQRRRRRSLAGDEPQAWRDASGFARWPPA
jgi:hypothetical protein